MKHLRITLCLALSVFFNTLAFSQMALPALPEDISPLLIGEKIPEMMLQNEKGEWVNRRLLFAGKPTVLISIGAAGVHIATSIFQKSAKLNKKFLLLGFRLLPSVRMPFKNWVKRWESKN